MHAVDLAQPADGSTLFISIQLGKEKIIIAQAEGTVGAEEKEFIAPAHRLGAFRISTVDGRLERVGLPPTAGHLLYAPNVLVAGTARTIGGEIHPAAVVGGVGGEFAVSAISGIKRFRFRPSPVKQQLRAIDAGDRRLVGSAVAGEHEGPAVGGEARRSLVRRAVDGRTQVDDRSPTAIGLPVAIEDVVAAKTDGIDRHEVEPHAVRRDPGRELVIVGGKSGDGHRRAPAESRQR